MEEPGQMGLKPGRTCLACPREDARLNMGNRRRTLAVASATAVIAALIGCGGGDIDVGPLWVETDVVVADIDNDGRNDVLTLAMVQAAGYGSEEGRFLAYLQTATPGVFAAPVTYSVGQYPWRAALADIDGDGRPDLVITDPGANTVWLVLQDAAHPGRFLAPQPLITGVHTYEAAVADLNDDDAPDVAAGGGATGLVVRYQDATIRGTFGPQLSVALPGRPSHLATGDVDGDGLTDVLAWVYTNPPGAWTPTGGLVVAYQEPAGFDVSGLLAPQTGINVARLAIADVNGDGRGDLFAFETPFSTSYATQLVVVPQTAVARTFDPPVHTPLAGVQGRDDAVLADLNQDGVPDTAVAGFWPEPGGPYAWPIVRSQANLLMNDGLGAFALHAAIPMPFPVSRVTAGDLDGDGRNDILLLGDDENRPLVMIQSAPGVFQAPRALY